MSSTIHIGLIGWHALPAIFSDRTYPTDRAIGGAETGMWTIARSLAKRPGLKVTVFVASADRPNRGYWPREVEGVKLIIHDDHLERIRRSVHSAVDFRQRKLRHFRPSLLWKVPFLGLTRPYRMSHRNDCRPDRRLRGHGIDVFVGFGNNVQTSRAVATAAAEGNTSIVSLQANSDVDPRLLDDGKHKNELGDLASTCRWTLRHADTIVCQSNWQADRLSTYFGRQGLIIRNPVDLTRWEPGKRKVDNAAVMWVGRLHRQHKRPMMMVQLARQLRELPVLMIANPADEALEAEIRESIPPNMDLVDYVPFEQMPHLLSQARVLVFTGHPDWEGFPNVLLQAAATHTPVVSASDFNDFLGQSGAGVAVGDSIEALAVQVRKYWRDDPTDWAQVDAFLKKHYDAGSIAAEWERIIRDTV